MDMQSDLERAVRDLFARASFSAPATYTTLSSDHVVVTLSTKAALRIAVGLLFEDNYVISSAALGEDDEYGIMVGHI